MMDEKQLAAYYAAHERAAFADTSDWGRVRLTGRDRLDLPHRLSTNSLKSLQPGQGAPTVFTNAAGRVMAFVTAYAGEDEAFLRTMPGQGAGVTRYLKSMIFWQDQVEAADLSAETAHAALYGPRTDDLLGMLTNGASHKLDAYGWGAAEILGVARYDLPRRPPRSLPMGPVPGDRRTSKRVRRAGVCDAAAGRRDGRSPAHRSRPAHVGPGIERTGDAAGNRPAACDQLQQGVLHRAGSDSPPNQL